MGKNNGKNVSKKFSGKYSHNLLDPAKQYSTDSLKTISKRVIQKTAEATSDLICNKIANTITKVSRSLPQNNSETVTNEYNNLFQPHSFRKKTENH